MKDLLAQFNLTEADLEVYGLTLEDIQTLANAANANPKVRETMLASMSSKFTADGFKAFFELVIGKPLLPHWNREVKNIFSDDIAAVIEAFRGSAKTTTFTIVFAAFLIGHFPEKSGLLIQVGDDIATDNSKQVADIIDINPGFKAAFPNVVPDKEKGWGAAGYEVKRTDMEYAEWRKLNAERKDPTFVGVGYKSRAIIGKRPYWLILDDIHDENNTASEREMRKVKQILKGTIFPAANRAEVQLYIGTPWSEADALHYCLSTGLFKHIKVPIRNEAGESVWPEFFTEKKIEEEKAKAGEIEFARMYLLDLDKTKGLVLNGDWIKYFPVVNMNHTWPKIIGVDYTSTAAPEKERSDEFSLTVGVELPMGRIVLEDGVNKRMTQAEAEETVIDWAFRYPSLKAIGIEAIITGNEFAQFIRRQAPQLPLHELRGGPFQKKKGVRFEKIMAPLFQRGQVWLSDAENPHLTAFKDQWLNWQGDALEEMHLNDVLDSAFCCIWVGKGGLLTLPKYEDEYEILNPMYKSKRQAPAHVAWFRNG